jgi:hypothetical protein
MTCPRCGGAFVLGGAAYALCVGGHTVYAAVTPERIADPMPLDTGPRNRCKGCHQRYVPKTRQYCTERCRRRRWKRGLP